MPIATRPARGTVKALLACLLAMTGSAACSASAPQHQLHQDAGAARKAAGPTTGTAAASAVEIPAGWFVMGDAQGQSDARPAHRVYLSAFAIDRFEVSNRDYAACVSAGACQAPERTDSETRPSYFTDPRFAGYPVIAVTYADAAAFCAWRGARLPTEAQWEKAARGTDRRIYPWGSTFDPTRLNYCDRTCDQPWSDQNHDDGYDDTAPVDAFPGGASPYGVMNMTGNVWEWVADWYDPNYYAHSPSHDPSGPATGTQRVTRGGGFYDDRVFTSSIMRRRFTPDVASTSLGFRCAT